METPSTAMPVATAIVVNYNSAKMWGIVPQSVKAVLGLRYRPLEVIIVDNGSSDGSFEMLGGLVEAERPPDVSVRLVRPSSNLGFARANIIGYRLRSPASRYVALINNDLAPEPDSLTMLIKYLEASPRLAGVQGLITRWDGETPDSYGILLTEKTGSFVVLRPKVGSRLRPIPVTYVDGAYSVYKVEVLERCGGLFLPYFFMYGDDYELGIRLWRCGYALAAVPVRAGRHWRSATMRGSSIQKYHYHGTFANTAVVKVMYGNPLYALAYFLYTLASKDLAGPGIYGFLTGLRLRRIARRGRELRLAEPLSNLGRKALWILRPRRAHLEELNYQVLVHLRLGLSADVKAIVSDWFRDANRSFHLP